MQSTTLDEARLADIKRYCASGDGLMAQGHAQRAVEEFNKAWELIPEPKNEWEASTWVLAAIGDTCFCLGKEKSARQALEYVMHCPGGFGNPFLHLRLGQVLFNAGELDAAADELMRAYMGDGRAVFEKEDPKYLAFLATRANLDGSSPPPASDRSVATLIKRFANRVRGR